MGARLSSSAQKVSCSQEIEAPQCKRRRACSSGFWDEKPRLIPTLPDEISVQILARIPRILHFNAKLVSRSWESALTSREYYEVRRELGTTEEWLYVLTKIDGGEKLVWHALDPVSGMWQRLPLMPNAAAEGGTRTRTRRGFSGLGLWHVVSSSTVADAIRSWLGKGDALEDGPLCGCAVGAVHGCLYVMGGFCRASATASKSVWRYDPVVNAWAETTSMSTARAYSKTAVLNDKLYVVGGVNPAQGGMAPLQSAEVFDPRSTTWSELPSMPFSKAQVLPTAFLAGMLKPIATGMASYKGKLYVPQSLYCWPFFVDVGGEVYDPETDSWVDMPAGMGDGWPAKQAGTKLSVIVDGDLYALDPSTPLDGTANIKVYDEQADSWRRIDGDVPIRELADSNESPYLLASLLGKLHVITKDTNHNLSVVQADCRNRADPAPPPATSSEASHGTASSRSIWKVVATRNAGSAELVSSVILDI